MACSSIKKTIILSLIFSLIYCQTVPSFARSKRDKVQVAFVGIKFEDLEPEIERNILERMNRIFKEEKSLNVMKPDEVQKIVGRQRLVEFFNNLDKTSFSKLAQELQIDYLFAGELSSSSQNANRVILVGKIHRFDRATNLLHKFDILKYYDEIGVEFLKFKKEFVKSIAKQLNEENNTMQWIILGGVAVAGILAMAFTLESAGREGGGTGTGGDRK